MTPEQNAHYVALARILRKPGPLQNLLREATETLLKMVPFDGIRYDISDKDGIWSRICRPGQDPERPGFGTILSIRTKEELTREGDELSVPLGFGGFASGRIFLKKSGGFTDEEVDALDHCSDLFTLALRSRPLDPRARPRGPFDEPAELL